MSDVRLCFRRKRGEKGEVVETIEDVIVRRLTAERIEELKKLLRDTQDKYRSIHTGTLVHTPIQPLTLSFGLSLSLSCYLSHVTHTHTHAHSHSHIKPITLNA